MENEKILRAALFVGRIRESSPNAHAIRLRYAKKLSDIIDSFIAEEVRTATAKSKFDQSHLSWSQVAKALEISKSAAFTRYGGNHE